MKKMHRRMSIGGLAGIGNPSSGNLTGKSHITALPTNTETSQQANTMPNAYMAAKLKKGAVKLNNKNSKPKSKTEVANLLQLRINDKRVDKYINKYNKLLEQGTTPADAKKFIMNEIKTLKIPLGTLNIRKS